MAPQSWGKTETYNSAANSSGLFPPNRTNDSPGGSTDADDVSLGAEQEGKVRRWYVSKFHAPSLARSSRRQLWGGFVICSRAVFLSPRWTWEWLNDRGVALDCSCPVCRAFISQFMGYAGEGMRTPLWGRVCIDWELWRGAPCYRAVSCVVGPPPPSNCRLGGDSRVELFKSAACLCLLFPFSNGGERLLSLLFHRFPKCCEIWRLRTHPCLPPTFTFMGIISPHKWAWRWFKLV